MASSANAPVDTQKVEQIKQQLAAGTYKANPHAIANSLVSLEGQIGGGSKLILGKLSGRHALRVRLYELGYEVNDEEIVDLFARFKAVADRKREVEDADLHGIVGEARRSRSEAAS